MSIPASGPATAAARSSSPGQRLRVNCHDAAGPVAAPVPHRLGAIAKVMERIDEDRRASNYEPCPWLNTIRSSTSP